MNASAGPPPLLAQAPPLLAAAPPPDALCFAGFVTLAFVPFAILSRAAEHGEWGRDFAPPWLLAAYGSLGAAYGACVFGVAPLAGAAHSYAFGLASVFASKHALVAAADAAGEVRKTLLHFRPCRNSLNRRFPRANQESSKGAPAMALLTVAAAGATQAAVRFAGTVRDCAPVFAAVAAFVLLATARLAARWRAEVCARRARAQLAQDGEDRRRRRR